MTRRSKRELERVLDGLGADVDTTRDHLAIVYEDATTGEWYDNPDMDGNPVDPPTADHEPLMVILKGEYVS